MTYEEAINLLKNAPIMGMQVKDSPLPLANAVDVAIKALKKQLPKKPKWKIPIMQYNYNCGGNIQRFSWICRNCNIEHFSVKSIRFCPSCGQAIDWSDEE